MAKSLVVRGLILVLPRRHLNYESTYKRLVAASVLILLSVARFDVSFSILNSDLFQKFFVFKLRLLLLSLLLLKNAVA